jgi:methionyl-tRNA formyltransferase
MLVVSPNKPEPVLKMASTLNTPVQKLGQLLLSPTQSGKILVNAMSAKILPTAFLASFALRVNLHPSFLP